MLTKLLKHEFRATARIMGPLYLILLAVAIFFSRIYENPTVNSIFKGMRPAVVALILQPVFSFARGIKYWEYGVFVAIAAAISRAAELLMPAESGTVL